MSNLLVQNIKHTNNTTAQTIDTSGRTTVSIMNNDSTYRSDGGSVTQNMVQGLTKSWVNFNGTGTIATRDSFNISSLNDDGSGRYDFVYTNNMSNQNYAPAICGAYDDNDSTGNTHIDVRRQAPSTNLYSIRGISFDSNVSGSFSDCQFCYAQISGDLA
mgnify:FL=1|tara:strand:+ start:172 stop:648 length:477 start_codon:yes stop_codon:yes gene_type:complete